MTLGFYCGDDPFGPFDHPRHDITHCFQSLTILLPPSLFMLLAFLYRMSRIYHHDKSSLLIDPLPRFPQIISATLALLSLFFLIFFILQGSPPLYLLIYPSLSFLAWSSSILLLRFEHTRALPFSPFNRTFYFLSFIASIKESESSLCNFLFATPVMAYDILVFLHLFLSTFMLRYAITGIGESHLAEQWGDLEEGLVDEGLEEEATPSNDRSMWKRFLNFSHGEDEMDGAINAESHSYKRGVMSSLDAREDKNPFASNPFEGEAETSNGHSTREGSNPFVSTTVASTTSATASSLSSKVKSLTAELVQSHPLSGSTVSLPTCQEALIAGRTLIQYQLHLTLTQPALISGDSDVDSVIAWKRYREFEGLHSALLNTGRKYGLAPPELPPAPKKKAMEEGRERLEGYLKEVMEQALYWEDVAEFGGVMERLEYIAQYKAQVVAQREQERRDREEAVKKEAMAAEAKRKEKDNERRSTATSNGMSLVKVTVERPAGLDYKYQIITVGVTGWSRWLDEGERGEGEEEEEKGRKKGTRSTLNTPVAPSGSRRKGGSANPSLSSSAFYLTLDLPIKTSVGDYTVYHTLTEITDFRLALTRHFTATQPSLVASLPALSLGSTDATERDEEEMMGVASAVEVFFQSLISVQAFQCNVLYAFLERRKAKGEGKLVHLVSGQKPLASFSIATGEWKTIGSTSAAGSRVTSPNVSVPSSPAMKGEGGGRRRGRGGEKKAPDPYSAPLFPEAVASITPSHPSQLTPSSPSSDSSLRSSLTQASPLSHANSSSDPSTSHRFTVAIPSFSLSNPADPKSHILFSLLIREYFSLTSFIEWHTTRRYSDFEAMHQSLQRHFAGYPLPALPKKRKVGKRKEGEVEERRVQLELYVQQVINVRMFQVDEFFAFFDMNNANRQFSVGTQVKGVEGGGGLEGVKEGGGGEEGEVEGRMGRGNGRIGTPERKVRRVEEGRRVRGTRAPPQSQGTTNPFDM